MAILSQQRQGKTAHEVDRICKVRGSNAGKISVSRSKEMQGEYDAVIVAEALKNDISPDGFLIGNRWLISLYI